MEKQDVERGRLVKKTVIEEYYEPEPCPPVEPQVEPEEEAKPEAEPQRTARQVPEKPESVVKTTAKSGETTLEGSEATDTEFCEEALRRLGCECAPQAVPAEATQAEQVEDDDAEYDEDDDQDDGDDEVA